MIAPTPGRAALGFRSGGVPASQFACPLRVRMLDTAHLVAHSLPAARVHAGEPEPGQRTQPPGPPWPVGLKFPAAPAFARGDGGWSARAFGPASKTAWWRTHGLPPKVGNRDRRRRSAPAPRSGGTGRRDFPRRLDATTRDARPSDCRSSRGGRESSTTQSVARPRAWAVGLAGDGGRRLARPAAPRPLPLAQGAIARHPVSAPPDDGGRGRALQASETLPADRQQRGDGNGGPLRCRNHCACRRVDDDESGASLVIPAGAATDSRGPGPPRQATIVGLGRFRSALPVNSEGGNHAHTTTADREGHRP